MSTGYERHCDDAVGLVLALAADIEDGVIRMPDPYYRRSILALADSLNEARHELG